MLDIMDICSYVPAQDSEDQVSEQQVKEAIESVNKGKAAYVHAVTVEHFLNGGPALLKKVAEIINSVFHIGLFPCDVKFLLLFCVSSIRCRGLVCGLSFPGHTRLLFRMNLVSTKIYDKRDDFDFEIVNFPFLDGDVPRSTSYGVYISQLIRFARASSYVADFNTRSKLLTQKLLKQGYQYHKLRKTFSKFYRRYYDLISKFQVGLKSLLRQVL